MSDRTRSAPAFLNADPPPWGVRSLAACLILIFAAAAAGSVLIRLPETVDSPFVLIPRQGLDPVRVACDGFVVDVLVADAQPVVKGQPLFVIRSDVTTDRTGELATLQVQVTGALAALANARKKYESQHLADEEEERRLKAHGAYLTGKTAATKAIQEVQEEIARTGLDIAEGEVESLKEEIALKQTIRDLAQPALEKAAKLQASKAMSELEYLQIYLETKRNIVALHQSRRELDSNRLKIGQLKGQIVRQKSEARMSLDQLANDSRENESALLKLRRHVQVAESEFVEQERGLKEIMEKNRVHMTVLKKELERSQGGEVSVAAPRGGTVLRLRVKGAGAVVRSGDVLCELAGAEDSLQSELTVSQSRMGRIAPGQRVRLLYDAFPFQRYGIRYGTVRWVSPAGETMSEGRDFRVLVDNDDDAIWAGGQSRPLLAGMGGRAGIVVGKRSLVDYAFEPLRHLKESLAEPPPQAVAPPSRAMQ